MHWVMKKETGKMVLTNKPLKVLAKEMYMGKVNNKRQVTDIFHYDRIK